MKNPPLVRLISFFSKNVLPIGAGEQCSPLQGMGVFADRGDYKYFVLFVVLVSVRRLRKPSPAGKVADGEAGKPRLSDG